jgi:hypothetical protein
MVSSRYMRSRLMVAVSLAVVVPLTLSAGAALAAGEDDPAGCPPELLFCETFDGLAAGPASSPNWSVDTQQGSLAVEPVTAGSQQQVLHVHTDANGRAFLTIKDFAAPGNTHFGRLWAKVDQYPTGKDFAHFVQVQVSGAGSAEIVRPVGGQFVGSQFLRNGGEGRSLFGIGADGGPTGDWTDFRESATAASGRWQCLEWSVQAEDNAVQLTVDGTANPELVASTTTHGGNQVPFILPTVDTIAIGWQVFQADVDPGQFDMLYDNIAVSSTRLGCGPAPAAA